jgi:hypothetical protein
MPWICSFLRPPKRRSSSPKGGKSEFGRAGEFPWCGEDCLGHDRPLSRGGQSIAVARSLGENFWPAKLFLAVAPAELEPDAFSL